MIKVSECMSKKPVYVRTGFSLKKVLSILSKNNISGCPVVSSKRVVGMITQTDIINQINVHSKILDSSALFDIVLALLKPEKGRMVPAIRNIMNSHVRDVMKKDVISIEADEDIYKAAALMSGHDVDRLPVTKSDKLVGVIGRKDLIRAMDRMMKAK